MGSCWPAQYGPDDIADGAELVIDRLVLNEDEPGVLVAHLEFVGGDGRQLPLHPSQVGKLVHQFSDDPRQWSGKRIRVHHRVEFDFSVVHDVVPIGDSEW